MARKSWDAKSDSDSFLLKIKHVLVVWMHFTGDALKLAGWVNSFC